MKTKLHYLLIALLLGFGINAQTVKLTGTAVGGWVEGGLVTLSTTDNITYTAANLQILGTGGGSSALKFTEGTWASAAGYDSTNQPVGTTAGWDSGTSVVPGTDIVCVPGFWNLTYNYITKAYAFTPGVNPNPNVSLDGTAITGGTTALASSDGINYSKESLTIASAGTGHFVEKISDINPAGPFADWSSVVFPYGTGTAGGADIAVEAGTYYVSFDKSTGSYAFDPTIVSIIGDFDGWNDGSGLDDLTTTDNITFTLNNVTFASGGSLKFRDNHSWNFNYGGTTFPSGTGVYNGGTNIAYGAGTYNISFNRTTLEYTFTSLNPAINFTGSTATPATVSLGTTDGVNYDGQSITFAGVGTGSFDEVTSPVNIAGPFANWPVATTPTGVRNVTINKNTGVYSFPFVTMGLTGAFNGWGGNVDFTTIDGITYTLTGWVLPADTTLKIRENHSWTHNFGSTTNPPGFPSGTGIEAGATDIAVPAGTYNVTFDRNTLAYTFTNVLAVSKFDANKFSVYPNPTKNSWNFTSGNSDISSVKIVDMLGKTVSSKNTSAKEVTVDASALSKGMYFAKITSGDSVQTIKVMKN